MRIFSYAAPDGTPRFAVSEAGGTWALEGGLDALLAAPDFNASLMANRGAPLAETVQRLVPLQSQEVWACGVSYQRSQEARKLESGGSDLYDRVYAATRPELFFKGTLSRTVGPGEAVGIRRDSRWNVPEPELTLVLNRQMNVVGFAVGNDMSSRDIEGENALYLPQAKVYQRCLSLGPEIVTADEIADPLKLGISMQIRRAGQVVFSGETSTGQLKRTFEEMTSHLGRSQHFHCGALLMTGTGIVPGEDFTLEEGDEVEIEIEGIGRLRNPVQWIE